MVSTSTPCGPSARATHHSRHSSVCCQKQNVPMQCCSISVAITRAAWTTCSRCTLPPRQQISSERNIVVSSPLLSRSPTSVTVPSTHQNGECGTLGLGVVLHVIFRELRQAAVLSCNAHDPWRS